MENLEERLEEIQKEQVSLFEDLRDCLALERNSLIRADVSGLWQLLERKQNILDALNENAELIENLKGEVPKGQCQDSQKHRVLKELSRKVVSLKEEIRVRAKENMVFIRESLAVFEELISIFSGSNQAGSYARLKVSPKSSPPLIIQREV